MYDRRYRIEININQSKVMENHETRRAPEDNCKKLKIGGRGSFQILHERDQNEDRKRQGGVHQRETPLTSKLSLHLRKRLK